MLLSDNDYGLIQKLIDNNLSEDEQAQVNSRMEDADFQSEVNLQKSIVVGFEALHRSKLRAELKATLPENVVYLEKPKSNVWYWAAACISIAAIAVFLYFSNYQNDTPEKIFLTYYEPYPATYAVRGSNELPQSSALAFKKYNNKEFAEAQKLLAEVIQETSSDVERLNFKLLLGNCYLNIGPVSKSIELFKEVIDSNELILAQHAKWYLVLALIHENKMDEALSNLNSIIELKSIYADKALQLKSTLIK